MQRILTYILIKIVDIGSMRRLNEIVVCKTARRSDKVADRHPT